MRLTRRGFSWSPSLQFFVGMPKKTVFFNVFRKKIQTWHLQSLTFCFSCRNVILSPCIQLTMHNIRGSSDRNSNLVIISVLFSWKNCPQPIWLYGISEGIEKICTVLKIHKLLQAVIQVSIDSEKKTWGLCDSSDRFMLFWKLHQNRSF